MRQIIRLFIYTLIIIGSGLFIWTMLPDRRVEQLFTINPDASLFSEKLKCEKVQDLMNAKYLVNYPESIRSGESGEILVIIEKPELIRSQISINDELEDCGILLEVWIDGKDMIIFPKNKIIEPFLGNQNQRFGFEIFPKTDQLNKGTIWIYVVYPNDKGTGVERIPMFAIPFVIQIRSFFGISVRMIRILSSLLAILSLVFLFLQNDPIKKRK
jgi:hypothetical protein